jgi:ATP-dependent DNA helicase DinG
LRGEDKTLVVSTANVALQDQIFSKDLPLLRKIIELRFTPLLVAGVMCPRNLAARQQRAESTGSAARFWM